MLFSTFSISWKPSIIALIKVDLPPQSCTPFFWHPGQLLGNMVTLKRSRLLPRIHQLSIFPKYDFAGYRNFDPFITNIKTQYCRSKFRTFLTLMWPKIVTIYLTSLSSSFLDNFVTNNKGHFTERMSFFVFFQFLVCKGKRTVLLLVLIWCVKLCLYLSRFCSFSVKSCFPPAYFFPLLWGQ